MSKLLDDSEVIFDRQVGNAGEMEPDDSVPNRRREEEWLEATEPYHGARPRTTEFDRPADEGLGATSGGLREPHRNEGHQPLGPGDLPERRKDTGGRNGPLNEWSPVTALEDTVSRMQRELNVLQTENRFLRTPRASVPVPLVRQAALTTTKVPLFNGSTSWEQYLQVFDATRKELTDALSSHYGSPGRLANYRR